MFKSYFGNKMYVSRFYDIIGYSMWHHQYSLVAYQVKNRNQKAYAVMISFLVYSLLGKSPEVCLVSKCLKCENVFSKLPQRNLLKYVFVLF